MKDEAAAQTQACLVDPDQAASRGPKARFGPFQSSQRQQTARV